MCICCRSYDHYHRLMKLVSCRIELQKFTLFKNSRVLIQSDRGSVLSGSSSIPCLKHLRDILTIRLNSQIGLVTQNIASYTGSVLCIDHTFKTAKKVYFVEQLCEALLCVMNEFGIVIGFYLTLTTSLGEISKQLSLINARYSDQDSFGPDVIYTDICCAQRKILETIFPSLSHTDTGCRVLLDVFHLMNRYPVPKKHFLFGNFMTDLREAFFISSEEDRTSPPMPYSTQRNGGYVRRLIPEPSILVARVDLVIEKYRSQEDFITAEVLSAHRNCRKHIMKGCVSDCPNVELYFVKPNGPAAQHTKYKCARGTSQLEALHRHLADCIRAHTMKPDLYNSLLHVIIFRWNVDRQIDLNLLKDVGTYDWMKVQHINSLIQANQALFDYSFDENEFLPQRITSEKFGLVHAVVTATEDDDNDSSNQKVCEGPLENLVDSITASEGELMSINALQFPVVDETTTLEPHNFPRPFRDAKEISICLDMILSSERTIAELSLDLNTFTRSWNEMVFARFQSEGIDIFRQISFKHYSHLKAFFTGLADKVKSNLFSLTNFTGSSRLKSQLRLPGPQPPAASVIAVPSRIQTLPKAVSVSCTDQNFTAETADDILLQNYLDPNVKICSACYTVKTQNGNYINGHTKQSCPTEGQITDEHRR